MKFSSLMVVAVLESPLLLTDDESEKSEKIHIINSWNQGLRDAKFIPILWFSYVLGGLSGGQIRM